MNHSIDDLLAIMDRLRDPEDGCPWDREQTFATIAPYTIEEAYEVADAIDRGDFEELRDELGDLLFQVVFYARLAKEQQRFVFADVLDAICEKMRRRHPHVFGDAVYTSDTALHAEWERHKQRERRDRIGQAGSVMDGIAQALPALVRAGKLQRRATRIGAGVGDARGVLKQCRQQLGELEAGFGGRDDRDVPKRIGELLFSCVALASHAGIDAEQILRQFNAEFERQCRVLESEAPPADTGHGCREPE